MKKTSVDQQIFWPALIVLLGIIVPLVINPEAGSALLDKVLNFITGKFGWMYLWSAIAAFGVLAYLGTGKYANVKFGEGDPEYSTVSWIAMMFCAGIGCSLLYWGTIEWAYYYIGPPFGIEPKSVKAAEWAATYGLFHWGFTAWAIYCIPTLPIAYIYHVKKQPVLRMSTACRGVLGKHADGFLGKVIDIFFIFGLIGGVGTSLGLATPMLSEAMAQLLSIERSFGLDVVIIIIWTIIFGTSVYLGLEKGIKVLSDINVYLAIALGAFVLFAGPTEFIIKTFTNSMGLLTQNFLEMSFYTDPIANGGFPEGWTIFYWAWWVAYAPFMALFVAKISKGRTIKEVILAECLGGSIGCWVYFAILGNTGLYYELNNILPVTTILSESGAPAAIVATIASLPLGTIALVIFVVLAFIFQATTLDSSAYTLAAVATKELGEGEEPARWHRVFWAIILAGTALSLMFLGGLKPLQTSSVVAAGPVLIILIMATMSFFKWLKEDYGDGVQKNETVTQLKVVKEKKVVNS